MKPETPLPEKDTPAIGVDPSLEHHDEAKHTYTADYSEGIDVNRVHGAILREKSDPQDGQEPIPLWIIAICLAVMMWGGYYLGKNTANFRSDVFDTHAAQVGGPVTTGPNATADTKAEGTAPASPEKQLEDMIKEGKSAYGSICASCHQAGGGGQAGQYPPLAGSEWVLGDKHVLVPIVLHGLHGPITVAGATYNNNMQAWGATIKDKKMAAILTYIRNSWGNKADIVTADDVKALREHFKDRKVQWTEEELKALKANPPK
ncbi:MAG: cytochrome c [Candidatus Methylacidiphilales bacterium]|nr:cytochrome c [Candidatus Methylacidiphilales bacterium]